MQVTLGVVKVHILIKLALQMGVSALIIPRWQGAAIPGITLQVTRVEGSKHPLLSFYIKHIQWMVRKELGLILT